MAPPDQLALSFDFGPSEPDGSHAVATPAVAAPAPARIAPDDAPTLVLTPAQAAPDARVPIPRPAQLPEGSRWREVETPQQTIGFVLQRSRRRSIGFVIADDGLRITAPNWVTLGQVDDAVREKAKWILAKLREWQERKEKLALGGTRWVDGGELPYLGKRIVLGLAADRRQAFFSGQAQAPQDSDTLWLPLAPSADQTRVRDAAQAWLQQRASDRFGARLAHFLQRTGLTIRRWRLSSAATRWGSCTSDGTIMLNWRLIHFAPDIIDYVIAHELAHLREMNHSHDFWAEVGHILPDFEQAKQALRRHDPASLP
ncbi:MAG: M48 family metallopeptidase [Bordetella sp.]|uniref:M48 family metallopeptidase n=1 Tax=Bordetella sp. TaxID=28081 RepID=UPI003F7BD668